MVMFTRRQWLGGAALLLASTAAGAAKFMNETPVSYTFEDDFTGSAGSAPDPAKWAYDLGGGGWGNGELEIYTRSIKNAYVDGNSNLVIRAVKTVSSRGISYTSARLKTQGKFSQLGGRFQARIKLNSQPGLWPAFWLLGQDITTVGWPQCGELDIMEDFGHSAVESSVHSPAGNRTYSISGEIVSDTNWHVYQLDWDATGFVFSQDNTAYLRVPKTFCPKSSWVFGPGEPNNGGMFILLNLAVGGDAGTPPASVKFPVEMLVDYVRVQKLV
jgi:beta-glucanase (GH16 family)